MNGHYEPVFVAISIFIAILSAFAAHDLAGRISAARVSGARMAWLMGAATAMGIGIWSMHYIGMLALRMPMAVRYDWPTVLVSLLAAVVATSVTLVVASRKLLGPASILFSSLTMGAGIAGMHYLGMAAMRMPATVTYTLPLLLLSIAIAVAISYIALKLTFTSHHINKAWPWTKVLSATLMGCAIPAMHYVGMAAATFNPAAPTPGAFLHAVNVSDVGAASIALVTIVVLGFAFVSAFVDRRFSHQAKELEGSEERYRKIIGSTFDAFLGFDTTGKINDWNAQACATFGWTADEAIGRSVEDFLRLDGDTVQGESLLSLLRTGVDSPLHGRRLEITAIYKSGVPFSAEMSISAIHIGVNPLFAAFVHDVTERKLTERSKEEAREAAESASRAKSEFVANMSHEIRTPLNGIIGMTDLALETELTLEQREYLETVKLSADSLLSVINDILDFSKIEAGKVDIEEIRYDFRECLELTLKTLALRADEKGIELLCDISPGIPEAVLGDSCRLRQVVTNIIGNAIKFTAQGEVALHVSEEQVATQAGATSSQLHFTISDTGIGIAPDKLETIFQSFSQADTSTTREYGGTGLGLTISRRLVEMMQGRIWIESELGRGSHFHFTLPVKAAEPLIRTPEVDALYETLRGVRVLIIDDNKTNRRILEGLVRNWGMLSTAVADGRSALDHLTAANDIGEDYDLILTDMHMPKMDGFGLITRIRQNAALPSVAIMMLSSGGHRGDAARCQELGVAAYLLKPIRQTELREAIARAISGRAITRNAGMITQTDMRADPSVQRSLNLLLAEDNMVNQKLAVRLLEKRGHAVTVVDNGLQALKAVTAGSFDLVFMDVQMPLMDGISATARIRELEETTGLYQPIVAMTALAMQGDRDRCLAAHMDGYISKPLRPADLDEILDTYRARRRNASVLAAFTGRSSAIDASDLLERIDGDVAFITELSETLRAAYPRQLRAIATCIDEDDAAGVERSARTLKGALSKLSAVHATSIAGRLEFAGSSGVLTHAKTIHTELAAEIPRVLETLDALTRQIAL